MGQNASLFAGVIVLALTACGPGGDQSSQAAGTTDRAAREYFGPVTYRYDRRLLTPANVRIAVPPEAEPNVNALKLVPVRSAAGAPGVCPDDIPDCPIEDQPGLSLALLERPFVRYSDALGTSELADRIARVTVGGAEGIAIDFGELDGLETEYRLVPLGERALLIKLQLDGQSPAEESALEDVIGSIDLGG